MRKFETHDGKLFLMLDEPVPLTEDATNVLVQFVTHGVIGKYVMHHWLYFVQENKPIYVDSVDTGGDITVWKDGSVHYYCPFPMFEIIGTLVEEGSAEWALYQMMQRKVIINHNRTIQFMLIDGRVARIGDIASWDSEHWLRIFDDTTGWEIYEPCESPEPQSEPQTDLSVSDEPQAVNPSEVRVSITLEGTVRAGINESCFEISTPNGGWATIGKDQIKDSDLKLVESLLKAQEEK